MKLWHCTFALMGSTFGSYVTMWVQCQIKRVSHPMLGHHFKSIGAAPPLKQHRMCMALFVRLC